MSHLFNAADSRKKLDRSSAKTRLEDVNNFLDKMEDRRMNAEDIQSRFASTTTPAFYPGYDADDVDDGRLDQICSTGFIPVGEIPDEQADENDLTDDLGDEIVWRPQASTTATEDAERPRAPASRQKYCKSHRDRFVDNVKFIGIVRRGVGIVPYSTGMLR